MSSSNNYYKFVRSMFGAISILPKVDKVVDLKSKTLLIEAKCNTEIDILGFNTFNNILKNKKEQKRLRTIHEQMFDVYVIKLTYATQVTTKSYSKWLASLSTILLVLTLPIWNPF